MFIFVWWSFVAGLFCSTFISSYFSLIISFLIFASLHYFSSLFPTPPLSYPLLFISYIAHLHHLPDTSYLSHSTLSLTTLSPILNKLKQKQLLALPISGAHTAALTLCRSRPINPCQATLENLLALKVRRCERFIEYYLMWSQGLYMCYIVIELGLYWCLLFLLFYYFLFQFKYLIVLGWYLGRRNSSFLAPSRQMRDTYEESGDRR